MNLYRLTVNVYTGETSEFFNSETPDKKEILKHEEVLFDNLLTLPVRQALDLNQKEIFSKLKKSHPNLSSIILEEFP